MPWDTNRSRSLPAYLVLRCTRRCVGSRKRQSRRRVRRSHRFRDALGPSMRALVASGHGNVRPADVLADEQQRCGTRRCQSVREAVAEVQSSRVAALAEARPRRQSYVGLVTVEGHDIDAGFVQVQAEVVDTVVTEACREDDGALEVVRRRPFWACRSGSGRGAASWRVRMVRVGASRRVARAAPRWRCRRRRGFLGFVRGSLLVKPPECERHVGDPREVRAVGLAGATANESASITSQRKRMSWPASHTSESSPLTIVMTPPSTAYVPLS